MYVCKCVCMQEDGRGAMRGMGMEHRVCWGRGEVGGLGGWAREFDC